MYARASTWGALGTPFGPMAGAGEAGAVAAGAAAFDAWALCAVVLCEVAAKQIVAESAARERLAIKERNIGLDALKNRLVYRKIAQRRAAISRAQDAHR